MFHDIELTPFDSKIIVMIQEKINQRNIALGEKSSLCKIRGLLQY